MPSLSGQAVLVTGAARGIGAAIARELDARGARVAMLDIRDDLLGAAAEGMREPLTLPCDVTDREAVREAVASAAAGLGYLDAVVANAGIGPVGRFDVLAPDLFERTIDVNLLGVYRTLHAALPHVRERRGYMLAVASLAAPVHTPLMAHYAASKAGVEALVQSIRLELAQDGVAAGVAYFGWIDTEMVREGMADPTAARMRSSSVWPLTRDYPPEGAARAVAGGIERRAKRVIYPRWCAPIVWGGRFLQPLVDANLRRAGAIASHTRDR